MAPRPPRWLGCAALVAAGLCSSSLPALAGPDDLELVSRATGGEVAAGGDSSAPSISADGRLVGFASDADNLSTGDVNTVRNAFVRDVDAGTTTAVNRTSDPGGAASTGGALRSVVSADGRVVAWEGPDTLVDPMGTAITEIYVRELATGTTTLVSRATGAGGAIGNGSSFGPVLSADGRYVAFESDATNLSGDDVDGVRNVYLRDRVTNTTELVSRAGGPGGAGAASSARNAAISGDGRFVTFISEADNLTGVPDNATQQMYVRDRLLSLTLLVSRASGAAGPASAGGNGAAWGSLSADGRYISFASNADNLSAEDADGTSDVFLRDQVAATTTLVSRGPGPAGAPGDASSSVTSISADGRFVSFSSLARNLSDADADATRDIFVRDVLAGTTVLATRAQGPLGAGADGDSLLNAISADGRHVAFESGADNLWADDDNGFSNVFRRTLPPPAPLPQPAAAPGTAPGPPAPRAAARCAGVRATIVGTSRRDVIRGTGKRDVIAALGGNDLVRGLGGNDLICLGAGADRALGGPGADRILGGPGRDVLLGGPGPDRLLGQAGRDRALGGPGRDRCAVEARAAC
jgi:Tol biopolymer transport system component